jgi:hypothetical protein
MRHALETDYLVVGAGAMGLAFADEIIHGSKDARVLLVDRRAKAGGHWNDAYPFVTLHQPALYYGVNSQKLGSGGGDLVSRAEILSYDEKVIKKLTATGRFTFLPLCEYRGDGRISSSVEPDLEYDVEVHCKAVDATYMNVMVPSTTPPRYEVSDDVALIPINEIAEIREPSARYVIIGSGKTGIDAALFLLERGVDPDRITWIMPNDAWFLNRRSLMPKGLASDLPAQLRSVAQSDSFDEIFHRLESEGRLLRLAHDVWPTKYRCATVITEELDALRRIGNVVRMGRVVRIDSSSIELTKGTLPADPETLYIDCTADGLAKRPAVPIFDGPRITLQSISICQQVFSAAALAAIELRGDPDASNNKAYQPVPHPEFPADFLTCLRTTLTNLDALGRRMPIWVLRKRLSLAHHVGFIGYFRLLMGIARWGRDPDRIDVLIREAAETSGRDPGI